MADMMEIKNSTAIIIASLVLAANNSTEEDIIPQKAHEAIGRFLIGHEDSSTDEYIEDHELALRAMKVSMQMITRNVRKLIRKKLKEQSIIDNTLAKLVISSRNEIS